MLEMKQNPKSDFQALHSIDTVAVSSVETTLNQHSTISMQPFFQRCTMSLQRCFNVDMTSEKAISKLIWLVKSMNLQKIDDLF